MDIYRPYTYLIGWSVLNKWYYGVRYRKNCSPSDLFKTYFTSSKHVKNFIQGNGLPDVIQVRKTFTNSVEAIAWENKVLTRLKVKQDKRWLNMHSGDGKFFNKGGYKLTEEQLYSHTAANRLKVKDENYLNKLRKPKKNKENYSYKKSEDHCKNVSVALKTYNKDNPRTEEHKQKISESKRGKPNFKNRKPATRYTCSQCNKEVGGKVNLLRYHNDKCKKKPS